MRSVLAETGVQQMHKSPAFRKMYISRCLALMFAQDLSSPSQVDQPGFRKFLVTQGVVKKDSEIPTRQTVTGQAMDDIYETAHQRVVEELTSAPPIINLVIDMWTSGHGNIPFITVYIRFCDDQLNLKYYALSTELLPRPHTAVNIERCVKRILAEFGLEDREFIVVADGGSNVKKWAEDWDQVIIYLYCKALKT